MKRFLVVLAAMGLVFAFCASASAVDVKFSGSYYVEGMYEDNHSLLKTGSYSVVPGNANLGTGSTAQYFNRLRIQTQFKVAEGLSLVTRFDALEKKWGDRTWNLTVAQAPYDVSNRSSQGAAGARTQENIEWERAYMDFTTKIGRFMVGYQEFGTFGTVFFDTSFTKPGAQWFIPLGAFTMNVSYDKQGEGESVKYGGASVNGFNSDLDKEEFYLAGVYKFGAGDAGLLLEWMKNSSFRNVPLVGFNSNLYLIDPYAKAKFGNFYVEGELLYGFGDIAKWENSAVGNNISLSAWGLYLKGQYDMGPAYFGMNFAWVSGDDPSTTDKREGTIASTAPFQAGQNWSPTLIFKNDDHTTQNGNLYGLAGANNTNQFMDNIWFFQLYGGFKPVAKMDLQLKVAYMFADKKPWAGAARTTEFNSGDYGTEVDLVGTYKIFDNLTYMAGFGYFWTGDYYKGNYNPSGPAPQLSNDYILMHRLTLSF